MKITAILKGREDDRGRLPVVIRTNDRERKVFKTLPMKVLKKQFKKGRVVNHPQATLLNDIIKKELAKMELLELKTIERTEKIDLYRYWDRCCVYWEQIHAKKESSLRQYRYEKNKLQRFRAAQPLHEIGGEFFGGLLRFCYQVEGNCENTAWKTFSRLHAVLEQAVADKLLPHNPMNEFKDRPQYKDPKRDFLTREQLLRIEHKLLNGDLRSRGRHAEERRFAGLWFLIGCYTGLRYSDMHTFNKAKHVRMGRLIKYNQKTEEVVSLPLEGKIRELLERVAYRPLTIQNQSYNRILKVIGELCGLDVHMTAHISRHTCGMMLAEEGVDIKTIAKVLGHTSTKHTEIYARIANKTINEAMGKIIF